MAHGSDRPPRLVVLNYPHGGERTLGLVGKGVTFDSGGLSLKPTDGMLDMKCDMAGAATVLATVQASPNSSPGQCAGRIAAGGKHAERQGAQAGRCIAAAANGKTIEIHNTDAEGRLILGGRLAYAVEQKVDHLVDLATLTGACLVALGTDVAGLMSNNDAWADQVRAAAARSGELVWQLPMFPHYNELIKSKVSGISRTPAARAGAARSRRRSFWRSSSARCPGFTWTLRGRRGRNMRGRREGGRHGNLCPRWWNWRWLTTVKYEAV